MLKELPILKAMLDVRKLQIKRCTLSLFSHSRFLRSMKVYNISFSTATEQERLELGRQYYFQALTDIGTINITINAYYIVKLCAQKQFRTLPSITTKR